MKNTIYLLIMSVSLVYSQNKTKKFDQLSKLENSTINELFLNNDAGAKQFVAALDDSKGNAIIKNKTFRKGTFVIQKSSNKITLDKVNFDGSSVSFSSKKEIDILPGTTLLPDDSGEISIFIADFDKTNENHVAGLESNVANLKNHLYPNPATDKITLELSDVNKQTVLLLFDNKGMLLEKRNGNSVNHFDVSKFANGVYLLQIINGTNQETIKFIKK